MRHWLVLGFVAVLGACSSTPKVTPMPTRVEASPLQSPRAVPRSVETVPDACVQTREHRDEDYTPGGLYAPHIRDSAPEAALDISGLVEPEPQEEPLSRYGNRTPYRVLGHAYHVRSSARGYRERGIASWYGQKFHGRLTSSREPYDMCAFSAAHKTLPLPSYVRVTNLENGRSVVVRVNDRGPFHEGRIIDLSYAAAIKLGVDRTGTAKVEVEALTGGAPTAATFAAREPLSQRSRPASLQAGARHVIQVGSFGELDNARRAVDRLTSAGIESVDLERVRIDGRKLWRVRVGPLAADAAAALVEQVQALGFSSSRIFSE